MATHTDKLNISKSETEPEETSSGTEFEQTTNAHTEEPSLAQVLARCRGIHVRVAEVVGVDPSYVSRVAGGSRASDAVSRALLEELRVINGSINSYLGKAS